MRIVQATLFEKVGGRAEPYPLNFLVGFRRAEPYSLNFSVRLEDFLNEIFPHFANFKNWPKMDVEAKVNLDYGSFLMNGVFSNFFGCSGKAFSDLFEKIKVHVSFDEEFRPSQASDF